MTLKIKKIDLDEIMKHSSACYPSEACGILIGRRTGKEKTVEKVVFARNRINSPVEYEIDAESLLRAFELAEKSGMEIVGFFHSHPHHEAFWSTVDEERGKYWVGYSFLIVSPVIGMFRSYEKVDSGAVEEKIEIE